MRMHRNNVSKKVSPERYIPMKRLGYATPNFPKQVYESTHHGPYLYRWRAISWSPRSPIHR